MNTRTRATLLCVAATLLFAIAGGCSEEEASPPPSAVEDNSAGDNSGENNGAGDVGGDNNAAGDVGGGGGDDVGDGTDDTSTPGEDTSSPVDVVEDVSEGPDVEVDVPDPPVGSPCAPLPAATGTIVRVTPQEANALPQIVADAVEGTTILLEDGLYVMTSQGEGNRRLNFRTSNVTMRSASGDPEAVVLDGEYMTNEMLAITGSNVTIAEMTITRAIDHPIHVTPPDGADVTGTHLYRLRIIDGGEQFVKINGNGARSGWPDDGKVECSLFRLTDAGRPNVERNPGGCYTGGIDAHLARGWEVRWNRFEDIYCAGEGLAEHAVHFWQSCRDTVTENNTIINCARGIGYGLVENGESRPYADNPYSEVDGYIGHYDGIIRNNVIYADIDFYDTGIELDQARGTLVLHNTVTSTRGAGFFSSIDYRFENTDVTIRNNLTQRITVRGGAQGTLDHNMENISNAELFVDAANFDLHLAPGVGAIDAGVVTEGAGVDIDGEARDEGPPDLGADEVK